MEIETYEVTEMYEDGSTEDLALVQELLLELELEGQVDLLDQTGGKQFPYRKMEAEEWEIFHLLCPNQDRVENYNGEAIPLRVLQVIHHAKSIENEAGEPFFDYIRVMYPANADIDDPVVYGQNGKYDHSSQKYILARWGKTLAPLSELRKLAGDIKRSKLIAIGKKIMASAKGEIEVLEALSNLEIMHHQSPHTIYW